MALIERPLQEFFSNLPGIIDCDYQNLASSDILGSQPD
jgi:hypothetical protein